MKKLVKPILKVMISKMLKSFGKPSGPELLRAQRSPWQHKAIVSVVIALAG
jgi:hypothetical protein